MAAPSISSPLFATASRPTTSSKGASPSSSYSSNDSFLVDHSLDDDNDRHEEDSDNLAGDFYAIPHNLTSFLDRRPLTWRTTTTGLPLSTTDLLPKDLPEAALPSHEHHDVHDVHHTHTYDHRGRHRTARSRDALSAERLHFDMLDFVKATVWANHDTVRLRPSMCGQHYGEAPTKGIFVDVPDTDVPRWLLPTQGEHLHIHADGSAHMILSLADAAKAIECGWAERPPLPVLESDNVNVQYIAVHPPRCASELADWKRLVLASVRFCTYTSRELCIRRPERL
ncbi:hypothetical protein SEUCBS139899_005916 [Sporothrix eucalyptigena]|uniref:Luciferase domain-containing protein n=1 Tax=Sporothrix eucalyptigena TaxID=1812306 RepID=A0ABP0AXE1_9PEZI